MLYDLIILAVDDVFTIANRLINSTQNALKGLATVAAIALVVFTYFKTRAMVPVIVAIATAALVLWGVNSSGFLRNTTTETINQGALPITAPARMPA